MSSRSSPTFVNLDKPYPNLVFTVLIWGEDLAKFNPGPFTWDGKRVCATGMITSYRGSPEIVVKSPAQIRVENPKADICYTSTHLCQDSKPCQPPDGQQENYNYVTTASAEALAMGGSPQGNTAAFGFKNFRYPEARLYPPQML